MTHACTMYHRVVHSLTRWAFPVIVSFRDGWLRAFSVENRLTCISTITAIGEVLPW